MAFDYAYQIGDEGGTFVDLADYATVVRILNEGMPGRRGSNPTVPYVDGAWSEPFKFLDSRQLLLEVTLRYTDAAGSVTDPNGAAGHAYENLQALKKHLGWGGRNRRMLRRNDPHAGAVETAVEMLEGVEPTDRRYRFVFFLTMLDGVWRAQSASTHQEASVSSFPHAFTINTGGDYPIADPVLTFECVADGASPSLEQDVTGELITVNGSFTAGDTIVVDLGNPRSFTLEGARYPNVSMNRGWGMRLQPDESALGMTLDATSGTWTLDIDWRNKWL